jgi:type I restriction enzyme, R subunit
MIEPALPSTAWRTSGSSWCRYAKKVYVDRAFQRKTNELVRRHIGADRVAKVAEFVKIDEKTIELIKSQKGGDGTKVINLVKSIEKAAEENAGDPFLVALSERAVKRLRKCNALQNI